MCSQAANHYRALYKILVNLWVNDLNLHFPTDLLEVVLKYSKDIHINMIETTSKVFARFRPITDCEKLKSERENIQDIPPTISASRNSPIFKSYRTI